MNMNTRALSAVRHRDRPFFTEWRSCGISRHTAKITSIRVYGARPPMSVTRLYHQGLTCDSYDMVPVMRPKFSSMARSRNACPPRCHAATYHRAGIISARKATVAIFHVHRHRLWPQSMTVSHTASKGRMMATGPLVSVPQLRSSMAAHGSRDMSRSMAHV